ncbi:MAG: DNA-directed RNA polymerase specialized sigma24 family protein [Flavobacteriales bacterium]|jgi:DNA-directed RNA polymerase specialized sigma24 family protein
MVNCQLGDAEALQQLIKIRYPKLLCYAYSQIGCPHKAQDAVQNTFEVVSKSIGRLKDPATFAKGFTKFCRIRALTSLGINKDKIY